MDPIREQHAKPADCASTGPQLSSRQQPNLSQESIASHGILAGVGLQPSLEPQVRFLNTLSRQKELFIPLHPDRVGVYCCGPTVYLYQHIGNLRAYIFEDVLVRTLRFAGYEVKHVMNVTDVGHLVSDSDEGEDKMLVASKRENRRSADIADFYAGIFFDDCRKLNIVRPDVVCKATEHITEMIELIKLLEERGYTYQSGGNIYFAVERFPQYGRLSGVSLTEQQPGARIVVDDNKMNPLDFALWFTRSKYEGHELQWDSPWGRGYPGWHIECSAMASKYLGQEIDIHCGGVDHIGVHHTNEIAQSEAAFGKQWVKTWLHSAFLIDSEGKMSKSKGKFLILSNLEENGIMPLSYRYFCLSAHYRSQLSFSWDNLKTAQTSLERMRRQVDALKGEGGHFQSVSLSEHGQECLREFKEVLFDDLSAPRALAATWKVLDNKALSASERLKLVSEFDRVLALDLMAPRAQETEASQEVLALVEQRKQARQARDWSLADRLRQEIAALGYAVENSAGATKLKKTKLNEL